jgi:hypothetical protein
MSEVNQTPAAVTTQAGQGQDAGAQAANATEGQASSAPATTAENTEQSQTVEVVPEVYELKPSEGSPLSAARLESIAQYAKEQKLTQAQAQAILEREDSALTDFVNTQNEQFAAQVADWRKQVESDRELGGERLKENAELGKRAMHEIFGPEIGQLLDETGYGNNPVLFKGAVKLAKLLSNDKMVMPGAQGAETKTAAQLLYGNSTGNK